MPLVSYLKGKKLSFEHINYKDHHEFTEQDIANFNTKKLIITTEKDFMRLQVHKSLKGKLFYLPIQIGIDDSLKFDKLVSDYAALKR